MTAPTPTTEAALLREALAQLIRSSCEYVESGNGIPVLALLHRTPGEIADAIIAAPLLADRDRLSAEVEEMRAEAAANLASQRYWVRETMRAGSALVELRAALATARAEGEALRAERDEAQELLAPFSILAGEIEHHHPGWYHDDFFGSICGFEISLKPFRAAREFRLRSALAQPEQEGQTR